MDGAGSQGPVTIETVPSYWWWPCFQSLFFSSAACHCGKEQEKQSTGTVSARKQRCKSSRVSLLPPFLQEVLDLQSLSHVAESTPLVSPQRKSLHASAEYKYFPYSKACALSGDVIQNTEDMASEGKNTS